MIRAAIALIHRDGRWYLQRREAGADHLPGLWEFPGGKVEPGEPAEAALRRELLEEVAWVPDRVRALEPLVHAYPERTVELHPFLCEGPALPGCALAWGWFRAAEAARLPVPDGNGRLLALLRVLESGLNPAPGP